MALLKFMALGIPIVTSSVPCFREVIVDDESGLIASMDEKDSFADRIFELLWNPGLASGIGQAALKRIRSQFSIQRLADDMMDLYDKILVSKSRRNSGSS